MNEVMRYRPQLSMLKNLSFLFKSLQRSYVLSLCHVLQIRIHVGDRRETFECLHQRIGQQFDIDAGKACDEVFVL